MLSQSEIKHIRSLHQKKYRTQKGLFLVEGVKNVSELLQSKMKVQSIFATNEAKANIGDIDIQLVSQNEMKKISALTNASSIMAVAEIPNEEIMISMANKFSIVLVGLRDPGNVGTILRTAHWFGFDQVILSPDCVEVYNPKVVQASMGSLFNIPIFIQETGLTIEKAKNENTPCWATTMKGEYLNKMARPNSVVLFIGNEARGISEELISQMDASLSIPGSGQTDSLNAAVATGICCAWLKSAL